MEDSKTRAQEDINQADLAKSATLSKQNVVSRSQRPLIGITILLKELEREGITDDTYLSCTALKKKTED